MKKEELEKLVLKNSIKQIALKKKKSIHTIYRYLRDHGIEIPKNRVISKEELESLYLKYSARQIGDMLGYSHQCILNWIEEYGLEKNNTGARPKHYPTKEELATYLELYNNPFGVCKNIGISSYMVKKLLEEYGLEKKGITKEYLKEELSKKSVKQIALESNVTVQSIYSYKKKFGL